MPVNFSRQENEIIANQRKPDSQLPRYLLIETRQTLPISRDMEGYLILQKASQKQKIQSWIKSLKQIQLKYADRDSLLQTYLESRSSDSEKKVNELDSVMGGFTEFRDSLFGEGDSAARFSEIADVSIMATALQRPLDQIVLSRDVAFHENVVATLQRLKLGNQFNKFLNTGALNFLSGADQILQNELDSWQGVVASYSGRNE
jgi:hypothetical protein